MKNPWKRWKLFRKYSKLWNESLKGNPHYMSMRKAIRIGKKVYDKAKILEEDLVVVRRQDKPLLDYSDGKIYTNYGHLSTSISGDKTEYGKYVAYIRIPKGEKILYIEGVSATEEEFEIMVPPGKKIYHLKNKSKHYSEWTM